MQLCTKAGKQWHSQVTDDAQAQRGRTVSLRMSAQSREARRQELGPEAISRRLASPSVLNREHF